MRGADRKPLAQPVIATDRTCEHLTGIPWRTLAHWLADHNVAILKVGRRSTFRLDRFLDAWDAAAGSTPRERWDETAFLESLDGDEAVSQ